MYREQRTKACFHLQFSAKRLKGGEKKSKTSIQHGLAFDCTLYCVHAWPTKTWKPLIASSHSLDNPEAQAGLAAGQISPLPKTCSHYSSPLPRHSQNTNTLTHAFHSWLTRCLAWQSVSTLSQETTDRTTSQTSRPQVWKDSCLRQQKPQKLPEHCSR